MRVTKEDYKKNRIKDIKKDAAKINEYKETLADPNRDPNRKEETLWKWIYNAEARIKINEAILEKLKTVKKNDTFDAKKIEDEITKELGTEETLSKQIEKEMKTENKTETTQPENVLHVSKEELETNKFDAEIRKIKKRVTMEFKRALGSTKTVGIDFKNGEFVKKASRAPKYTLYQDSDIDTLLWISKTYNGDGAKLFKIGLNKIVTVDEYDSNFAYPAQYLTELIPLSINPKDISTKKPTPLFIATLYIKTLKLKHPDLYYTTYLNKMEKTDQGYQINLYTKDLKGFRMLYDYTEYQKPVYKYFQKYGPCPKEAQDYIRDYYKRKQDLKQKSPGSMEYKIHKVVGESAFNGKLAQKRHYETPRMDRGTYHIDYTLDPAYDDILRNEYCILALVITSAVRYQMLSLALKHKNNLYQLMTDGLFLKSGSAFPQYKPQAANTIGKFKKEYSKTQMLFCGPNVYFIKDNKNKDKWTHKISGLASDIDLTETEWQTLLKTGTVTIQIKQNEYTYEEKTFKCDNANASKTFKIKTGFSTKQQPFTITNNLLHPDNPLDSLLTSQTSQ